MGLDSGKPRHPANAKKPNDEENVIPTPLTAKTPSEILKELRGDMSIQDFAKTINISWTTLERIEFGYRATSLRTAVTLAKISGRAIRDFYNF